MIWNIYWEEVLNKQYQIYTIDSSNSHSFFFTVLTKVQCAHHTLHCTRRNDSWLSAKLSIIWRSIVAAALPMPSCMSWSTRRPSLTKTQKKKVEGVRSGDRAGQAEGQVWIQKSSHRMVAVGVCSALLENSIRFVLKQLRHVQHVAIHSSTFLFSVHWRWSAVTRAL